MSQAPSDAGVDVAVAASHAPGVTPPSKRDRQGVFLTDVLVELGFADRDAVDEAAEEARHLPSTPERYLLDKGIIDERQLSLALAERNGLDHVDLELFEVDPEAVGLIDKSTAARYTALPIAFAPDGALIVALEDPYDMLGISDIEVIAKSEVRPVVATGTQIRGLIERLPVRSPQPPVESSAPGSAPAPSSESDPAPASEVAEEPVPSSVPEVALAEEPDPPPVPEIAKEPDPPLAPPVAEEPEPLPVPEVAEEPEPSPVPEPVPVPEPTPAPPSGDPGELSATLVALQDRTRHAIALAEATERRLDELQGVDARAREAVAALAEERVRFEQERRQAAEREQELRHELAAELDRTAALEQSLAEVRAAAELARKAAEQLVALSSAADAGQAL
jgi:hypothetical protein